MADPENAGIATNAQAARPISIERFIGVSLRRCSLRGRSSGARGQCYRPCRSSLSGHVENRCEEEKPDIVRMNSGEYRL